MTGKASVLLILSLLTALLACESETRAAESGEAVAVVFNERLPASKEVALDYARRRQVPPGQIFGFALSTNEAVSRADFRSQLQTPLMDQLVQKGLFTLASPEPTTPTAAPWPRVVRSGIRYLVLCYGVPLKILSDGGLVEAEAMNLPATLRRNEAAVDSELAWLPLSRQKVMLTGPLPNPFFRTTNCQAMHPTNGLLLVARLDGPSPAIARGLVGKAIEAETHGLWGRAYFDTRGLVAGNYAAGDEAIGGAAAVARNMGFETVLDDSPLTFPATFPLSQIALYAGWYDDNVSGPFARPEVEFMPGAFAYHLHSFSASTLRATNRFWAGPLLAKGATATIGYVEEPYLYFTSDLEAVLRNLLERGASYGEAAWSAERALSWQTTVVGDPLYRPFAVPLDLRHQQLEQRQSRLIEWSHLLVVNRNLVKGARIEEAIDYLNQIPFTQVSAVLTEKLGDLRLRANEHRRGPGRLRTGPRTAPLRPAEAAPSLRPWPACGPRPARSGRPPRPGNVS